MVSVIQTEASMVEMEEAEEVDLVETIVIMQLAKFVLRSVTKL